MDSHVNSPDSAARVDAYGDEALPDLTSGLMWIATAVFGVTALAFPGSSSAHMGWAVGVGGFALAWGCFSVWLGLSGRTMSIERRAVVTAATLPVVALALWATGGATSFLQPVMLLTALFIAYFFPPRLVWPLVFLFVGAFGSPLLYDPAAIRVGYPARLLMFAMAVSCATAAMGVLKRRLLRAEARQRTMAERDPLTGVSNRRSFDSSLARALEEIRPLPGEAPAGNVALIVFDFNDFKRINDLHGHPVGDAVLSSVADACRHVVRDGDCLARIGGDEFALIAPGAGQEGVRRVVAGLDEVISRAQMPSGVGSVEATFGWAVAPDDGLDARELFRHADERLLERKRGTRRQRGRIRVGEAVAGTAI